MTTKPQTETIGTILATLFYSLMDQFVVGLVLRRLARGAGVELTRREAFVIVGQVRILARFVKPTEQRIEADKATVAILGEKLDEQLQVMLLRKKLNGE